MFSKCIGVLFLANGQPSISLHMFDVDKYWLCLVTVIFFAKHFLPDFSRVNISGWTIWFRLLSWNRTFFPLKKTTASLPVGFRSNKHWPFRQYSWLNVLEKSHFFKVISAHTKFVPQFNHQKVAMSQWIFYLPNCTVVTGQLKFTWSHAKK